MKSRIMIPRCEFGRRPEEAYSTIELNYCEVIIIGPLNIVVSFFLSVQFIGPDSKA